MKLLESKMPRGRSITSFSIVWKKLERSKFTIAHHRIRAFYDTLMNALLLQPCVLLFSLFCPTRDPYRMDVLDTFAPRYFCPLRVHYSTVSDSLLTERRKGDDSDVESMHLVPCSHTQRQKAIFHFRGQVQLEQVLISLYQDTQ